MNGKGNAGLIVHASVDRIILGMAWLDHLTPAQRQLAGLMSATSESCYCATWHVDTEWRLWRFLIDPTEDGRWGLFPIAPDVRESLRELSLRIDGWICWSDADRGGQPTYIAMVEWLARYDRRSGWAP